MLFSLLYLGLSAIFPGQALFMRVIGKAFGREVTV